MILEPHVLYINDKPRAITMAANVEQALESYRMATLSDKKPEGETIRAVSAWDAPVEDVLRVGMLGIYQRMFSADMAMQMAREGRKH
jgi:hypothetical protein